MNWRGFTARLSGLVVGVLFTATAIAHPLGNATVNRQAQIKVEGAQVKINYLLDLAEIPTLVAAQDADVTGDGAVSNTEWKAYAGRWARALRPQLALSLDGRALALALQGVEWSLVDGAAGLQQLKVRARYVTTLRGNSGQAVLAYHDESRPQEAGWREVWVDVGAGASVVESNVPQADRSRGLTQFPGDGSAFPEEISARVVVAFSPPVAAAEVPLPEHDAGAVPIESQARVEPQADVPPDTRLATVMDRAVPAAAQSPPIFAGAWSFFQLGMHHIATGWDHLVFLFGLLLFSQTMGQLLKIVTAFTLAHSTTLGLASMGLVTPPGTLVEPAIALSIAYVGLANLLWRHRVHGVAVSFGFGLVHGFGFAGALAESLSASLVGQASSGSRWLIDLAAFNLGIETFQVALLCVAVPLLRMSERFDWSAAARRGAAFAVLGAGLSWFVLRLSGM